MRIGLLCPANLKFMPYVKNYTEEFDAKIIEYDIFNWDRLNIEYPEKVNTYRDKKSGHKRNYIDYYKYREYLISKLSKTKYDKIIIFGIQLGFFLSKYLYREYKGKYIFDIRDYNKVINFFDIKRLIDDSYFTVISSTGFKEWLPKSKKIIINHNTRISNFTEIDYDPLDINKKLVISYIGAVRDFKVQKRFINSLSNSKVINLHFHGEGSINRNLYLHISKNRINNVLLTGRYEPEEEIKLYEDCNMVNMLIPSNDINSRTLLPNRLYNAVINCRPIVTLKGSYCASVTEHYGLGIALDSFNDAETKIIKYIKKLDYVKYRGNRKGFLDYIIAENQRFKNVLNDFIKL